jgi:ABC-type enterochelin transport system ATPase subunit
VSHALNEVANYVDRIALVTGTEQPFRIGTVDEIMSEEVLSGIYGIPVEVSSFEGHRVVIARRKRRV